MKKSLISSLLLIPLAVACSGEFSHPDTSACEQAVEINPFYQELFSSADASIEAKSQRLQSSYGHYFDTYAEKVIRIGSPSDTSFCTNLQSFLSWKENPEVVAACDTVVDKNIKRWNAELSDAFSCLAYYFPSLEIPNVYLHISGFNAKMFVDSAIISVSVEQYLGANCRFYQWLEVPQYARTSKTPERLPLDVVKAIIYSSMPDLCEKDDILTSMLYQGRVLYCLASCFPDKDINEIFGFTEQQLEWCQKAEQKMWGFLAEQNLLYTNNPLDRNKLINESPYTSFFGEQSPGRAALWNAFQIVRSYMKEHPETTLEQLMQISDSQAFLINARYIP